MRPFENLLYPGYPGCLCLFFLAFLTGLAGCSLLNDYDDVLLLRPNEESLPVKPDYWEVRWLDGRRIQTRRMARGGSAVLKVTREHPLVISARAVTDGRKPWGYKPAGLALARDERVSESVVLKWEEGFAADILLNMASQGISPENVNIKRFREAVRDRGGNNPWNIDGLRLGKDIAAGKLWVYSFRRRPMAKVVLPLPPGSWTGEYPPEKPFKAEAGGWKGVLPEGLHRFFRLSGTGGGSVMSVMIDKNGRVTAVEESN